MSRNGQAGATVTVNLNLLVRSRLSQTFRGGWDGRPTFSMSGGTSQRNGGTSWDRLAPASDNPARYDRQGDSLQTLEWQEPEASAEEDAEREE